MTDTHVRIELGERSYSICIGSGLLGRGDLLRSTLDGRSVLVISDENVASLHLPALLGALPEYQVESLILPPGEASKNVANWQLILDRLIAMGAQRDVTLLALGGGVVGDLTGFAAACYMRGVGFVQLPTSLLAQVDASVGGKTAINHASGKNLIGAFYQPRAVLIDLQTLDTLPEREFLAGLAEVIKVGLIRDQEFFDHLSRSAEKLRRRDALALRHTIEQAVRHKAAVVALDEREQGARALLNLGHTFGHAIENLSGYGQILHGEAVAIGIAIAATVSQRLGLLDACDRQRIVAVLEEIGLPTALPAGMDSRAMVETMRLDKKNRDGRIRLVLLDGIGAARLNDQVSESELELALSSHPRG